MYMAYVSLRLTFFLALFSPELLPLFFEMSFDIIIIIVVIVVVVVLDHGCLTRCLGTILPLPSDANFNLLGVKPLVTNEAHLFALARCIISGRHKCLTTMETEAGITSVSGNVNLF